MGNLASVADSGIVLPLADYTTSFTCEPFVLPPGGQNGMQLFLNIQSLGDSSSLQVLIQGKVPGTSGANSIFYTILDSGVVSSVPDSVQRFVLAQSPQVSNSTTSPVTDCLPKVFQIVVTAGNSAVCTYGLTINCF